MNLHAWVDRVWSVDGPKGVVVRSVLQVLARHINHDPQNPRYGKAWPAAETIGALTDLSERAVRAALKRAAEEGWIRVESQPGSYSIYEPTMPEKSPLFGVLTPDSGAPRNVVHPGTTFRTPRNLVHPPRNDVPDTPARRSDDLLEGRKRKTEEEGRSRPPAPSCPLCETPMDRKEPRRGKSGGPFWGCPKFPDCRGKLNDGDLATSDEPRKAAERTRAYLASLRGLARGETA